MRCGCLPPPAPAPPSAPVGLGKACVLPRGHAGGCRFGVQPLCAGWARDPLGMDCREERAERCPACGEASCLRHYHQPGRGSCPARPCEVELVSDIVMTGIKGGRCPSCHARIFSVAYVVAHEPRST